MTTPSRPSGQTIPALKGPHPSPRRDTDVSGRPRPGRLVGVDAARGLAIIGMLIVHLTIPTGLLELPAGRSSALFAVLAGVTLTLLTGRTRPPSSTRERWLLRRSIALRGATLTVLGLALWQIPGLPFAVIIDVYGVLFIVLIPLLFARRRTLIAFALLSAIAGGWIVIANGFVYTPQSQRLENLPSVWFLTGQYPAIVFAAYVLAGMIAGRSGLTRMRVQIGLIAAGVVLATIGYGVGSVVPGQYAAPHTNTTWEVLGDGGTALAVIGTLLLLARFSAGRLLLTPLSALGSMSLTVYVLQVFAVLFWPWTYLSWQLLVVLILGSTLFALVWGRFLGRGPLEWLVAKASLRR